MRSRPHIPLALAALLCLPLAGSSALRSAYAAQPPAVDTSPYGSLFERIQGASMNEAPGVQLEIGATLEGDGLLLLALGFYREAAFGPGDVGARAAARWLAAEEAVGPDLRPTSALASPTQPKVPLLQRNRWHLLRGAARASLGAQDAEGLLSSVKGAARGQALLLLGHLQRAAGRHTDALNSYFSAAEASPSLPDEDALIDLTRADQAHLQAAASLTGALVVEPPLPAQWLVPYPRRQALLALGKVAQIQGQSALAVHQLRPLLAGGPLAREARLITAIAQWNAGGLSAAIEHLDALIDGGDLIALQAQFSKRALTPEVGERGYLTQQMRALHGALRAPLKAFSQAHSAAPAGALEALRAELAGSPTLPADALDALQLDPELYNLRRRLRQGERELLLLSAARVGSAEPALRAQLDADLAALRWRCGVRALALVDGLVLELDLLKRHLRPEDVREEMFSPSYFSL